MGIALSLLALLVVVVGLGLFAASRNSSPGIEAILGKLEADKKQALVELCKEAGIQPSELRPVFAWDDRLLSDERNRLSLGVANGKIRALRIAGKGLGRLPDLSALVDLEVLFLDGNHLTEADLSRLGSLTTVNLVDNQIVSLAKLQWPKTLKRLLLGKNQIADLRGLAGLLSLKELDLSDNQVESFDALVALPLEEVNLSKNRIARFPPTLPNPPTWKLTLDHNPVLSPPGYMKNRSYTLTQSGSGGGKVTREGVVQNGAFELTGTWQEVAALRRVELATTPNSSAPSVTLTLKVGKGRVRVYLHEPDDVFDSPWIKKGMVAGFGFAKVIGWVYADADPGKDAVLKGRLVTGTGNNPKYEFQMEPLGGEPAADVSYRITPNR